MAVPKFSAELSLGRSGRTYRGEYLDGSLSQNQSGAPVSVLPNQLAGTEVLLGDEAELADEEVFLEDEGEAELEDTEVFLEDEEGGAELEDTEEEAFLGDEGEADLMDEAEAEM